jgi:hypothetical protein
MNILYYTYRINCNFVLSVWLKKDYQVSWNYKGCTGSATLVYTSWFYHSFFEEERGPRGHGREIRNVFLLLVPKSFLSYSHIFLVTISKTIIHLLSV